MKPTLSDYLNSINQTKQNIVEGGTESESAYPPYIVNRCLGSFKDSVMYANEMNKNSHLPKKLQYDFLINSLKPRKRFSPWYKKETLDDLELVKEYYGYNTDKALNALKILTREQLDTIRERLIKGGTR